MTSKLVQVPDEEPLQSSLPPKLVLNPRRRIEAEEVCIKDIEPPEKNDADFKLQLVACPTIKPPPVPTPKFPLNITWYPNTICFELKAEPVVVKIWIWNLTNHSIYFNYCGLWNDTARFGAGWRCYPHTRFWLPPGFHAVMFVKATPREISPIPCANAFIQIAAGNMRDNVAGYFSIPIQATFGNYITPPAPEGE